MNYDISKPAPMWAREELTKRRGTTFIKSPSDESWHNCSDVYKHAAWLIATHEKPPVDPQVILARRLYKAAYRYAGGLSGDLENDDHWKGFARAQGVNAILGILNEKG